MKSYFVYPGFKYLCVFRTIKAFNGHCLLIPIVFLLKLKLFFMQRKYGIQIPVSCRIGEGFFIGHWGTIVINSSVKIGSNVNIS